MLSKGFEGGARYSSSLEVSQQQTVGSATHIQTSFYRIVLKTMNQVAVLVHWEALQYSGIHFLKPFLQF